MKNKMKKINGFGLIEVITALGIATVVITSLVALSLFTIRSSLRSKLLLEGTKIADKEIELIRAYRDSSSWKNFLTAVENCTTEEPCYMDTEEDLEVTSGKFISSTKNNDGVTPTASSVTRSFSVEINDSKTVCRVSVEVFWMDGNNERSTFLYTDLTNWQQK